MFGKLTEEQIEDLLKSSLVARIGCHDERTYVVPVSYAYDGEYFYFHSMEGLKTQMIRNNPEICIQVDEMNNMADWKSVVCWGSAKELSTSDEKTKALQALISRKLPLLSSETTHLFPNWPFDQGNEKDVPGILFGVHITEKTGRFEKSPSRK